MITFDLHCPLEHKFEGWFKDREDFLKQQKKKEICCPICGNNKIRQGLSAPSIIGKREALKKKKLPNKITAAEAQKALYQLSEYVKQNCEDVGKRFPEEARKIHYGEAKERGIYGEATKKEEKELKEEGIPLMRIPKPPKFEQ